MLDKKYCADMTPEEHIRMLAERDRQAGIYGRPMSKMDDDFEIELDRTGYAP